MPIAVGFTGICASVCLSVYSHDISKTLQLGLLNVTRKCFTTSPGNTFILGLKGQRSRSRGKKTVQSGVGLCTPVSVGFF